MTTTETKFARADLSTVDADGTFTGYASLFGRTDLGRDRVLPGAFAASLARRGPAGIRMLFQHDPNEPIGVWLELREDQAGLFVKGRLATDVARAREVLALMRAGALDGLSIGYRTVRGRTDDKSGIRSLAEVDLFEISVVTFPMLPEARVAAVKGGRFAGRLPTTREFERYLVQDAGLSRSAARTIVTAGFKALTDGRDAAGTPDLRLAEKLRRAASLFHQTR